MSTPSNQTDSPEDPDDGYKSYLEIVWRQFCQYPLSIASLWGIVGMFGIALVIPAFALDAPFFANVQAPGELDKSQLRELVPSTDFALDSNGNSGRTQRADIDSRLEALPTEFPYRIGVTLPQPIASPGPELEDPSQRGEFERRIDAYRNILKPLPARDLNAVDMPKLPEDPGAFSGSRADFLSRVRSEFKSLRKAHFDRELGEARAKLEALADQKSETDRIYSVHLELPSGEMPDNYRARLENFRSEFSGLQEPKLETLDDSDYEALRQKYFKKLKDIIPAADQLSPDKMEEIRESGSTDFEDPEWAKLRNSYGISFPWFTALFNLNYFENNIDIFFNFLLFTIPLNFLLWFVFRAFRTFESEKHFRSVRGQFTGISIALQIAAVVGVLTVATASGGAVSMGSYLFWGVPSTLIIGVLWIYLKDYPTDDLRNRGIRNYALFAAAVHAVIIATFFAFDFRQPYFNYVALGELPGVDSFWPFFEFSYRNISIGEGMTGQGPSWAHWLGTDAQGRDVLVRLLYGTRISLTIGIVAMGLATIIGMTVGSIGGYFGGWVDMIVLRIIEVFMVFPAFYLILTLSGFVKEPSVFYVMGIIGIVYWTGIARLVRGEFLRLREEDFVQAAKALGLPERRVIFRHIMPNALGPVLVNVTFGIAGAILFEATISFLGVGDPTAPTWGQILNGARENYRLVLMLAPGFALFMTITMLNLIGEGIRDAMDPKLRK